jgi:hypothetical protein
MKQVQSGRDLDVRLREVSKGAFPLQDSYRSVPTAIGERIKVISSRFRRLSTSEQPRPRSYAEPRLAV